MSTSYPNGLGQSPAGMAAQARISPAHNTDRWRSFAERYVIARAASFRPGFELEDGWRAVKDAEKIYLMVANRTDPDPEWYVEKMERYRAALSLTPSPKGP